MKPLLPPPLYIPSLSLCASYPSQPIGSPHHLSLSDLSMAEDEEAPSFKLFGTVILKGAGLGKEEEAAQQATEPAGVVEAVEPEEALPCPRCKSKKTKFCYFNNYNVNQPRHFCKACHRYWTAGGALRNVPVGAGRRRGCLTNRRSTWTGRRQGGGS